MHVYLFIFIDLKCGYVLFISLKFAKQEGYICRSKLTVFRGFENVPGYLSGGIEGFLVK